MTLVDCTHPIETGMQVYPGDPDVSVEPHAEMETDGYRVSALACGSHTGTHVDAPSHTEPDGRSLDAFDVSRFRFDARKVTVSDHAAREPITVEDLPAVDGNVVPDADADAEADASAHPTLLFFHTGWDAHWGTDRYLDHPYLAPETAEWCAERGVDVALDTLSPDPTPSENAREGEPTGFDAHRALLGSGRLVVENLRNLASLPERFTLHAYPLSLAGDGAPVRAVADVETASDAGTE